MDKGLKILMDTYWSSKGWKKDNSISADDFEIAKQDGYMFDTPSDNSHQQAMEQLSSLLENITEAEVANAFLYSLSTRKLEYRSALGSYWYAKAIPEHAATEENGSCEICGFYPNQLAYHGKRIVDYNCYQFERYKWGGVRHDQLNYALFDLSQFILLPKVSATMEDRTLLHSILDCTKLLEEHNKAGKLRDCIRKQKVFKTNASEIEILLDILGICGVLASKEHPAYVEHFANYGGCDRDPLEFTNDFHYPLCHWHASDGINKERFEIVFGQKY